MIERQINQVIADLEHARDHALPAEMIQILAQLHNSIGLIEENIRALQQGHETYSFGSVVPDARAYARPRRPVRKAVTLVKPCPCECNRGQFCGGCGHAGCGRR